MILTVTIISIFALALSIFGFWLYVKDDKISQPSKEEVIATEVILNETIGQ